MLVNFLSVTTGSFYSVQKTSFAKLYPKDQTHVNTPIAGTKWAFMVLQLSKFGLRGLAEMLQQEIIVEDIHVSLIFPPDTDKPGFVKENKRKPRLKSIIAASSSVMQADEVAKKASNGIKSGSFFVPCKFEGSLLSIATDGLSPQRSYIIACVEVIFAGILRFAGLCFPWTWYGSIEKFNAQ